MARYYDYTQGARGVATRGLTVSLDGSLSEVARLITGTRWSGPLFFGLRKRSSRRLVARARKVAPGALLIREWRGAAHQVTVHDDGVVYRGKRYGSLSEVARLITGTRGTKNNSDQS